MAAQDFFPMLAMVAVQFGFAGMNLVSKLAVDSGMDPLIHVAYRQIFAVVALSPLAFFKERKTRPRLTVQILSGILLCSFFGVTVNQITYLVGLKYSTPTIACALSNITPAVTFLMAVPSGLEKVVIRSRAGQAKVLGTAMCVGGALILSLYHGAALGIGHFPVHWRYAEETGSPSGRPSNLILGPFLLVVSAVSWAVWFNIQARVNQKYKAAYSSSALMSLMATFQCFIVAVCFDHRPSSWSLHQPIRIVSSVYSGVVCSALAYSLMSWCIAIKGPLYVSVFSPLLLVIVAALSWAILQERVFVGTIGGSVLIVLGLYGVLWGKKREAEEEKREETTAGNGIQKDLESPSDAIH